MNAIGTDETHPEMHSESPEHASILNTVTNLFSTAIGAGEMETMDPEISARLVVGLLQHTIIEAFVSGEGEGSEDSVCPSGDQRVAKKLSGWWDAFHGVGDPVRRKR